jgi:hypothetical protein
MEDRQMLSKLTAVLMLAMLTLGIGTAHAQPADYRTYFTFSAPVTLPGITLPAGKYLFRLADPDTSRKVINILNADGTKSLAMLHTIPNQMAEAPKDAEIRFMETSAKVPPPVKSWWYPGKSIGYEFIYPRKQALELAKGSTEPVLTTARDESNLATADLSRVDGQGVPAEVKVEENPAPARVTGRAQQGEIASGASSSQPSRDPRADETARSTARTELPRTASSLPSVTLLGALALALGVALSLRSRARA